MNFNISADTLISVYKKKLQQANEENALLNAEVIELTNKLDSLEKKSKASSSKKSKG